MTCKIKKDKLEENLIIASNMVYSVYVLIDEFGPYSLNNVYGIYFNYQIKTKKKIYVSIRELLSNVVPHRSVFAYNTILILLMSQYKDIVI